MSAGYFDDRSMLRRIHSERAIAFAGPRALLMQAAHPVAFAGFFASTDALDAPYERLHRTARIMRTIGFGPRVDADRATRRVRAMHRCVRGVLDEPAGHFPAGTPYAADDPKLLLWVLATLAHSTLFVYGRLVAPLSDVERDAYWRDQRIVGSLFGLADDEMPETVVDLDAYMDQMLRGGDLCVTPRARELGVQIVLHPPVPLAARPLLEFANQIVVGLLPADLRRQYGLSWDPARAVALRGWSEYARRVLVPMLPPRLRYVPARAA